MGATKKPSSASRDRRTRDARKKDLPLKQRLIKALAHPLRVQILDYLNSGEWSPRELQRELDEGLSQVSYHVKVLRDYDLIEMTRTEPRRGAVEHFYRAVERAFVPAGMTNDIPKSAQRIIGNDILGKIDRDVALSLKSGRFYARDDWHVSWTPADLDAKGCEDVERLTDRFVEEYLRIEAESANRRAESADGGEHIWTTAAVLVFGSELGEKEKARGLKRKRGTAGRKRG